MTPVIHPCPFCGYTDTEVQDVSPLTHAVHCPECDAIGPPWATIAGAIELWNARTPHAWHDDEGPT